jgi:hypothetical protein
VRFAWLVLLAACWTSEPPRATTTLPDDPPLQREPFPLKSMWRGTYRCSQGLTAMYLELTAQPDGALAAIFEFSPTPENPQTPTGAYRLVGTIRAGREGTFQIVLEPSEWIMQPDGFVMTALSATSSRRWKRLVGKIHHPACGELDVRRAD